MRVSDAFPGRFLKAADVIDKAPMYVVIDTVKIENVAPQDQPEENKPVVYFRDLDQGLVLNKTNASAIALLHGEEMDDWEGKAIELEVKMVDFRGKSVEAIRVQRASQQRAEPPPQPVQDDEDLPF